MKQQSRQAKGVDVLEPPLVPQPLHEAHHLLGVAVAAQRRNGEARAALKASRALRRRIGDARAEETERLLHRLQG